MTEATVEQRCDVCGQRVSTTWSGNFLIAQRHPACLLPASPRKRVEVSLGQIPIDASEALRALGNGLWELGALLPARAMVRTVSSERSHPPGAEVVLLPYGVRYIRQYDVQRDYFIGGLDVEYEGA